MGHYRSEMGYEEEDRSREEWRAKKIADMTAGLDVAIDQHGIAAVLAEILVDGHSSMIFLGTKYSHGVRRDDAAKGEPGD